MTDVCAFGYVTKESEVFQGKYREFTAGPPYFFSMALARLGTSVLVITKLAPNDKYIIDEMIKAGIEVITLESRTTFSAHTIYGKTLDERHIKILSTADPFTLDDIKYCRESRLVYVGPLTTKDFTLEFMREVRKLAPLVLDVQGFTRRVVGDRIEYVDWDWKVDGSKFVDIFKADSKEAKLLTGYEDALEAIDVISSWGPKEVLITSSKGVYLGVKGHGKYFAPFKVGKVVGRVGRGDTCTASYVHARLNGLSYEECVKFAAAATSLKLTYQGPLRNSESEVLKFVKEKYLDVEVRIE